MPDRDTMDSHGHRPQSLLFSFFGGVVRGADFDFDTIPTAVFVELLGSLGVAEAAARATLARMSRKGMLIRTRSGRMTHYALTPAGLALMEEGAERVTAATPFEHPPGEWTLLSYSLPESRRDTRHQLRAALSWAGFGRLRDGLWIAPGTVDVSTVLRRVALPDAGQSAEWFSATPMPGVDVAHLIGRAWAIDEIRVQHESFIRRWARQRSTKHPLELVTLLGADWLALLRADPGLPAVHLRSDWPADTSTAVFQRCHSAMLPAARRELAEAVARANG